jgi:hypothetical protein
VRLLLEAAPETFWQRDHKGQLPIQVATRSRRGLVRTPLTSESPTPVVTALTIDTLLCLFALDLDNTPLPHICIYDEFAKLMHHGDDIKFTHLFQS